MLPRLIALLLLVTLAMPMLVAQQKAVSDDAISDNVRQRLASDADVRGAALDVTVKGGVVTIKGRVHTDKGRKKATEISKKVKGVVDVDNQLKLYSDK
ncbi:MAG: BON domain-containing protein [Acidobacteriia bacterium]|jgi:osmotically-inducible protein OsmY|nr:BON domain-containing protein [Terriglobia bacterium]